MYILKIYYFIIIKWIKSIYIFKKIEEETLGMKDKCTVVSFDGAYVSKKICFDKKYEQMVEPYICV